MLTNEQVDELVRQVPFGREPYITFRAVFRAGMMEAARIAETAKSQWNDPACRGAISHAAEFIRAAAGEGEE